MSLRARVALAAAAATAAVVIIAGLALVALVTGDARSELDHQLERQAFAVTRPGVLARSLIERRFVRGGERFEIGVPLRVLDGERIVLATEVFPDLPATAVPAGFATLEADGESWRVLTATPPAPVGRESAIVLQFAAPTDTVEAAARSVRRRVLLLGGVAVLGAGGLGWLTAALALSPLARLRHEAERVSQTADLSVRVPDGQGPAEVDELGQTFNRMLGRIGEESVRTEAALHASRAFAANVAHELRTPLTSMQTNLDVLERNPDLPADERIEVLSAIVSQQSRLLAVLDALRLLARGDLAADNIFDVTDLADLVDASVSRARTNHPDASISLAVADGAYEMRGWDEGLRVMIDNLLDNAATHGRAGGSPADIAVDVRPAAAAIVLRIDDAGPGIPPDEREHVVERFVRGRNARASGSGLGLSLVAQQVELHAGSLEIGDAPAGGTRVTVVLPAATRSDARSDAS